MGDIQSEEERDIVLELKLPALPSPQPDTVLVVTLSYFNVITSALDTLTHELTISRTGECVSERVCVCVCLCVRVHVCVCLCVCCV